MSVIVTGGAGFLGSHLVDKLVAAGREVIVFDNLSTGRIANLEKAIATGKTTFVYADVACDAATLNELIASAKPDSPIAEIYHLASPASPNAYGRHPWETLAVNAVGTMSLIEVALAHEARFVYASTSEVYGDPLVHPQPETYWGNVDPIGPRSCYDEGKRFGEAAVAAAVRSRGLQAQIVRFFNCYGPRMEPGDGRLVPSLLAALIRREPMPIQGTGEQTRSMTYVDDAVAFLKRLGETAGEDFRPVNIGADDERSVLEIARLLAEIAGARNDMVFVEAREGDPQRRRPDMTHARARGWSPRTSLRDGLAATYAWAAEALLTHI